MFSDFIVDKVVQESSIIKSFYLRSKENLPLKVFKPGQYVALRIKLEEHEKPILRNYSLSDRPGLEYYRITIKKEEQGLISKSLYDSLQEGDLLELSIPLGKFHLSDDEQTPLVLISGGVGITPMMSMLEHSLHQNPNRVVYFIHSSRDINVQPMLSRLRELNQKHPHFSLSLFHSQPLETEIKGLDYDEKGKISKAFLYAVMPKVPAHYFLCGSLPFMQSIYDYLIANGVDPKAIKYEFFGVGRIDTIKK
jgi:nitric oxide dioxygenase